MTLTDRDRKILLLLLPVLVLGVYWFLVLGPKRDESSALSEQVTQAEADRDAAVAQAQQAEAARAGFETDYATMVRLGKAIPASVDMPSLLVQLNRAAAGTDISFDSITAGPRTAVAASGATSPSTSGSTPAGNAAPGGTPAGTAPGQAAEQAGEAAQTSDAANAAAGADPQASTSGTTPGSAGTAPATLDSVPLQFTFNGSFFHLADFFHDLKRFVRLSGEGIDVRGRLMTIDSLTLKPTAFPQIQAEVTATVYLSPKGQGATAGATPQGPVVPGSDATPASGETAPAPPTATAQAQ